MIYCFSAKKYLLLEEPNIATTVEICKNNTMTFHFLIQAGRIPVEQLKVRKMKTHVFAVRLFGNRHTLTLFGIAIFGSSGFCFSPFSKASNSCPFYDLFPLFSETFRSLKLSIFPPNLINAPRTRGTISRRREMDDTTGVEMCPFDSYSL